MRRSETLRQTYAVAYGIALALTGIVLLIGLISGAAHLVKHGLAATLTALPTTLIAGAAIVGSYFAAATLGAPVYHMLAPMARWIVGESLLSGIMGFIIYGTIGLTGVLLYVFLDIDILEFSSKEDAWRTLLPVTLVCAALTAILYPIVRRIWPSSG